jgi:ATP-dependent helicase/nuclease subunit B
MPLKTEFLGWQHPILNHAADYLIDRYLKEGHLDLHNVLLVLPGGRAGRQLQQTLTKHAADNAVPYLAPTITTIGSLPERLYRPRFPFADELTQSLAWVSALRAIDEKDLALLAPGLSDTTEDAYLQRYADSLVGLHQELTGELLTFSGVLERASTMPGFPERDRWAVLCRLQEQYLAILDSLSLWDLQTARMRAVQNNECIAPGEIILVGTADINGTLRAMLATVASSVTSLVFAPREEAGRFDPLGCLLPGEWDVAPTTISHDQFLVADNPVDETRLVAQKVASFNGIYAADQITIGIPDESMAIPLMREFQRHNVPVRHLIDRYVGQTTPYHLLASISDYLQHRDFPSMARLLRHTDISRWLSSEGIPLCRLTQLDDYHQAHLPHDLENWIGNSADSAIAREAVEKTDELLSTLDDRDETPGHWGQVISELLQELLRDQSYDEEILEHHRTIEALRVIRSILSTLTRVPARLASKISAQEAIRLILRTADRQAITSPFDAEAIELLGWLELPLDMAPAVIVTSFNDSFVPKAVNAGLFLPDSFRRHLEINDNQRRLARDAYALCLLQESGRDTTYISRKRHANGDPLQPSRLALQLGGDDLARRVLAFWKGSPARPPAVTADGSETLFQVPRPPISPPPAKISVTAFRDYINCPYGFYLQHVLRLRGSDDTASEMDGGVFGNLLHSVLRDFGDDPLRESCDIIEIQRFLAGRLSKRAETLFGPRPLATTQVQLRQAEARLDAFAAWQVIRTNSGWQIHSVEVPRRSADGRSPPPVEFLHKGVRLLLGGRIDRIDYHPEKNRWALFDYKTGDSDRTPAKVHLSHGKWVDLQLPLYRHIARQMGLVGPIDLGYILLPKDIEKTGDSMAKWNDQQLGEADDLAASIWQSVQEGLFWKPRADAKYFNGFDLICQQDVFERKLEP